MRLATDDNSVATEDDEETYGACRSENKGLKSFGIPLLVVNIVKLTELGESVMNTASQSISLLPLQVGLKYA